MPFKQRQLWAKLNTACRKGDPDFQGCHCLIFENTTPDDGRMWLDGDLIGRERLIRFLATCKK